MRTITTAKKGLQAVIIDGHTIVKHRDGTFSVHRDEGANGKPAEFDPAPFIEAFEKYKAEKEAARVRKIEEDRIKEAARIADLKERIRKCANPMELAHEFSKELEVIEIAEHWSDLHEGRSVNGFLISGRAGFEVMELAIEIHGIVGRFGQARIRAGEHHHTFADVATTLEGWQRIDHFPSDRGYTYRTKETEEEVFLDRVHEADSMESVLEIAKEFEQFEEGVYDDANGILVLSSSLLNDPDFSGYREDVYGYSFAFAFNVSFDDGYEFSVDEENDEEDKLK